jgi:hypothetical protein
MSVEHPRPEQGAGPTPGIDVAELAERVYRLMRDDLRLERERSGTAVPARKA